MYSAATLPKVTPTRCFIIAANTKISTLSLKTYSAHYRKHGKDKVSVQAMEACEDKRGTDPLIVDASAAQHIDVSTQDALFTTPHACKTHIKVSIRLLQNVPSVNFQKPTTILHICYTARQNVTVRQHVLHSTVARLWKPCYDQAETRVKTTALCSSKSA